ncbi:hypothetical protein ACH5RR_039263 [Cinchona calisaya]|uniref:RNase H type-1 domain-containing protein n=1 Tax=Cinchona calisaya TaxID=153742 RepID=A0ABD2Y2Z4_9GENT
MGNCCKESPRKILMQTWACQGKRKSEARIEETLAIWYALQKTLEKGWRHIEVQSNCKGIVDKVNSGYYEDLKITNVLEDIQTLSVMFQCCSFSFVRRGGNAASHHLAKFAISCLNDVTRENNFPLWLESSTG